MGNDTLYNIIKCFVILCVLVVAATLLIVLPNHSSHMLPKSCLMGCPETSSFSEEIYGLTTCIYRESRLREIVSSRPHSDTVNICRISYTEQDATYEISQEYVGY